MGGILQGAPSGSVYAPFITAELTDGSRKISVGNKSNNDGSACIQSFNYGASDGFQATLEIVDDQGGDFAAFFCKILNDDPDARQFCPIKIKWGWILAKDDGTIIFNDDLLTNWHYFMILDVNIKLEAKMKFILNCTDALQSNFETRNKHPYGTSEQKIPLKEAINLLCKDSVPPIKTVKYVKKNADGKIDLNSNWEFDGPNGIKDSWKPEGNHTLDVIWNWIKDFRTENKKGIVIKSVSNLPETNIYLVESDVEKEKENNQSSNSQRTYLVNGGDCSNVLSFTPDIRIPFSNISYSGGSIDNTQGTILETPGKNEENKKLGQQTINQVSNNAKNCYGTDAGRMILESDKSHQRENSYTSTYQPISAELKLVGDPKLDNVIELISSFVNIIVINPFSIIQVGDFNDWRINGALAGSACNDILSSSSWMILGVAHDIRNGIFTTVLKVTLPIPVIKKIKCKGSTNV